MTSINTAALEPVTFRAVTFNLRTDCVTDFRNRWRRRRQIVADEIIRTGASIIGVQELQPSMREDISSLLAGYKIVGQGRSRRLFNEHSDILIKNGDAEPESTDTFWLSRTPDRIGSRIGAFFPRICTSAVVRLSGGRHIRVYNTHLECMSASARRVELFIILNKISRDLENEPMPYILMGDFNAKLASPLINALRNNTHGFDGVKLRAAIPDSGTYHGFRGKPGRSPIDYIFVSEEFEIIETRVDDADYGGKYPSDHYPVITTLSLK